MKTVKTGLHKGGVLPGIKKIAVLRPNAIGDFVFSLPCLHALKAAYPDAQICYLGKQWHVDFLRNRPGPIDDVIVMPACPGVGVAAETCVDTVALDRFIQTMQASQFDLALQLYGGGRYANPFIRQMQAGMAIGLQAPDALPLDRNIAYGPLQNRRLLLLEVAALAGAHHFTLEPELFVTAQDHEGAAQALGSTATADAPLVLMQPGASDPRRRWPAARFAAVADALAKQGACIVINGSTQEAATVQDMITHMHAPAVNLCARLSLSALCGVLAQSALVVSNDTGPLHLALAIGTPCVGIYWLSNLIESAPLRQQLHHAAWSIQRHCPVCGVENLNTRCAHDVSFVDDVPVEAVRSMALALL